MKNWRMFADWTSSAYIFGMFVSALDQNKLLMTTTVASGAYQAAISDWFTTEQNPHLSNTEERVLGGAVILPL